MTRRLLTGLLAIMSVAPAFAQRGRPGGPGGGESRGLGYLTGYLGLTDSQKAQAQTIFAEAATASQTIRGQLTGARDALRAAAKANQSDAELERLGAAVGAVEGQLAAINAKAVAKFYALLTAEQKTKYDQMENGPRGPRGPRRQAPQ